MSKHTPLPWMLAYYATADKSHYSLKHGEKTIARTINEVATEEDEANLQFLAHASNCHDDLLDALRNLINDLDNRAFRRYLSHPVVNAARAAIAKATGE